MLIMNMNPEEDQELVLIVRINLDTEYMYFSDTENQIVLSGTAFNGKVISKNSIGEATKDVDVTQGGTIGQVGNWELSLARYTSYVGTVTTFDDFFNDFAPATSKPLLTSKTVDVGVVWGGAVDSTEITWLYQFYIENYDWTTYSLNLGCIEYDELVAKQLPYYVIQKEKDNGISYFINAPEESYGQTIPIVYGDLATLDLSYSNFRLAPCLRVDKDSFKYIISSHINHTIYSEKNLWKYIDAVGNMMKLTGVTSLQSNTRAGFVTALNSDGSTITGELKIQPRLYLANGSGWTYGTSATDPRSAFDNDPVTYCDLYNNSEIAFQLSTKAINSDIGILSGDSQSDIEFVALFDVLTGSNTVKLKYWHSTVDTINRGYSPLEASAVYSGADNTINYWMASGSGIDNWASSKKKWVIGIPWAIEELQQLEFHLLNIGSYHIRIKNCYLFLKNIVVYQTSVPATGSIPFSISDIMMTASLRNWLKAKPMNKLDKPNSYMSNDNISCYVKGYMYENWID
mgnify:CR=1 FL=1